LAELNVLLFGEQVESWLQLRGTWGGCGYREQQRYHDGKFSGSAYSICNPAMHGAGQHRSPSAFYIGARQGDLGDIAECRQPKLNSLAFAAALLAGKYKGCDIIEPSVR